MKKTLLSKCIICLTATMIMVTVSGRAQGEDFTWTVTGTGTETWYEYTDYSKTISYSGQRVCHTDYLYPTDPSYKIYNWSYTVLGSSYGGRDGCSRSSSYLDYVYNRLIIKTYIDCMECLWWCCIDGSYSAIYYIYCRKILGTEELSATDSSSGTVLPGEGNKYIGTFNADPSPQHGGIISNVSYTISNDNPNVDTWISGNLIYAVHKDQLIHVPGDHPVIGQWDSVNRVLNMTQDVYRTIVIDEDNLTLDGNDHKVVMVTGTSGTGHGVYLSGRTGVTIKNINIQGFSCGIYIASSSSNILMGNNLNSNRKNGINLYYANNNTLLENHAESNNGDGIGLTFSNNNTLTGNTILNNSYYSNLVHGIHLEYSNNNTLTNNSMSNNRSNFRVYGTEDSHYENNIDTTNTVNGKPVYYVKDAIGQIYDSSTNAGVFYGINCDNITIRDLTLTKNYAGVFLWKTQNSFIENVSASNNTYGIYLNYSSNNSLEGNGLESNSFGIYIIYSSINNTLLENTASNNKYGIYLHSSNNSTLIGNTAENSEMYGIALNNSGNSTLVGNISRSNNHTGIYLYTSSNSILEENTVSNNRGNGIYFSSSNNCILKYNTTNSNRNGIYLELSNDNQVYNNNFISNTTQSGVWLGSGNVFNLDAPIGGNYWNDHTAPDQNLDGFVDYPYILGEVQDNLPWVSQDVWKNIPPVANANGPYISDEGSEITFDATGSYDPAIDEDDVFQCRWDFNNDGIWDTGWLTEPTVTQTLLDDLNGTVKLEVSDGEFTDNDTATITVSNVMPVVYAGLDCTISKSETFTGSGYFTDPGDDSWSATVDYGDATGSQPLTLNTDKTFSLSHVYADEGVYTLTVTVTDDDNGSGLDSLVVTVINATPVVEAGIDATIDEGDTFVGSGSFTDLGSESWSATVDYGDSTGSQPLILNVDKTFGLSHIYADNGIYTLTVTVTDDDNNSGSDTLVVMANNLPPTASVTNDGPKTEGTAVTITTTQSDPGTADTFTYSFDWENDGIYEIMDQASPSASKVWNDNGTYTVGVIVKDDDGGTGTATTEVTVTDSSPIAEFTWSPEPQDEGSLVQFTDTSTSFLDLISSYSWDLGDGSTDTSQHPSHIYADSGTYIVTLTVIDDDGSIDTVSHSVTISNVPPTVYAGADQTVNEGDPVSFSGSYTDTGSLDTHTISWDFGDGGATPGTLTPSHVYTDKGVYTATLTVTDNNGGVGTDTLTVTVNNLPPVVVVGPDQTVNEGDTVSFSGSYTDAGSLDTHTISWDFGDGSTASETLTPIHVYDDDSIYTVTLSVTDDDGGTGSDTLAVNVNNVAPIVDAGEDHTVNAGDTVSFTGNFTDSGISDTHTIEWDFGDGSTASGTLTPSHIYLTNGIYNLTLTVTDDDGGVGTDISTITVNTIPQVGITSPIAGDTVLERVQITAVLSDADNDALTVSFLVDGIVVDTTVVTNTTNPKEVFYNWETFPDYSDGEHNIEVTVNDSITTSSDSITVNVENAVDIAGQIIAIIKGPTPDLPISNALLELILNGNVMYSTTTDSNGMYQISAVTPTPPGQKYMRRVTENGVELEIAGGGQTVTYNSGVDVLDEIIQIKNYSVVVNCPVDLHIYDTLGNHTGLIDNESELGIPNSWYSGDVDPEVIVILNPSYLYHILVVGTGEGTFDFQLSNYINVDGVDVPVTITHQGLSINTNEEISFIYNYAEIENEINALADEGIPIEEAINQSSEPPNISTIIVPVEPVQVDTEIVATADLTDSKFSGPHTATWKWDDGDVSPGIVTETDGSGSISGNHTYSTPGVYTVVLEVKNNKGFSANSIFRYIVIYAPDGGFVTGGGWIESPEGAYTIDPFLTGKANFGFVSKYKNGADIPTGKTQFNLHVADFNFHSTEYQWLVVAGPYAKFKGSGMINNIGGYGFMLTAKDGQVNGGGDVDKFRIRIWEKGTEVVVYDNQIGNDENTNATFEIKGGSIVIHDGS